LKIYDTMSKVLKVTDRFKLLDGNSLPIMGFGIWASPAELTVSSILSALKNGYSSIDGAQMYLNELQMGEAVRQSGLDRKSVQVTTKQIAPGRTVEETYKMLKASVDKINLGYVDLFLIHTGQQANGTKDRKIFWEALEKLKDDGLAKSIGVSNFSIKHMEELKDSKHQPVVNQLEITPKCQQQEVVEYCRKRGIVVEAYAPIMRGRNFDAAPIVAAGKAHGVGPAQVLLRWSIQKGFRPLPKSDKPERIASNIDIFNFELSPEEMTALDGMDEGYKGAICSSTDALRAP